MLKTVLLFSKTTLKMHSGWLVWLGLLVTLNGLGSIVFLTRLEGQMTLVAAVVSGLIQVGIFSKKGFVRLLGLGHAPWLFLIPWLYFRLPIQAENNLFLLWIQLLLVFNSLCLMIDAVDVIRYTRGERHPTLSLD